jgi:hypothetical protein
MARFQDTEVERRARKMKVVAYVDLRPVNWFTGKREPLPAGEGHVCDRCGAVHALVYTLLDTESKEQFKVGSGCAQRAFGFDPDKDPLVRKTIKAEKQRIEKEIKRLQDETISDVASVIAKEVIGLPLPPVERVDVDQDSYGYNVRWGMGDVTVWSHGLKSADKIPDERLDCLIRSFFREEVIMRLPEPYKFTRSSSAEDALARRIIDETMRLLFVAKRVK